MGHSPHPLLSPQNQAPQAPCPETQRLAGSCTADTESAPLLWRGATCSYSAIRASASCSSPSQPHHEACQHRSTSCHSLPGPQHGSCGQQASHLGPTHVAWCPNDTAWSPGEHAAATIRPWQGHRASPPAEPIFLRSFRHGSFQRC